MDCLCLMFIYGALDSEYKGPLSYFPYIYFRYRTTHYDIVSKNMNYKR